MVNLYAHMQKEEEKMRKQTIADHCKNTAKVAVERIGIRDFYHTIYLSALLHDMGKTGDAYQDYIMKAANGENVIRGSVNHTFAGVIYILEKFHTEKKSYESLTSELIAYAIGAHHGLFDCISIERKNGFQHRLEKEGLNYEEVRERFLNIISEKEIEKEFRQAVREISDFFQSLKKNKCNSTSANFILGLFLRMVLSGVMYGDRLDTAEFIQKIPHEDNHVNKQFWNEQVEYLEKRMKEKFINNEEQSEINKVRKQISDECKAFAHYGNGVYKLSVPTGAGKTLSTLRYAYTLAAQEEKQRVIFVIPLLSVLDQNSKVIREYTKAKERIGEHHSNIVQSADKGQEANSAQLVEEFWDEPIIITTLFQVLMNLFSNKTSSIVRMSSFSNSVIIMDEVQSIPLPNINLFNLAVNLLNKYFHTTIILSSATQPSFDTTKYPIQYSSPCNMIVETEEMKKVFKRTNIVDCITKIGMREEEIAEFCDEKLQNVSSLLMICNTKKQAKNIYKQLKRYSEEKDYELFHLSTAMCQRHRREILIKITECLEARDEVKVICVATQMVEAGIDFSFEAVVRIIAGLDNLVQAAGRANRNGEFGKSCNVYLVNYNDENLTHLKEIEEAQGSMDKLRKAFIQNPNNFGNDLLSNECIEFYYRDLLAGYDRNDKLDYKVKDCNMEDTLLNLLSQNSKYREEEKDTTQYFMQQAFLEAGKRYKVFDADTIDVVVPYKEGKEIMNELCSSKGIYNIGYRKELFRKASLYSVQIWKNQLQKLIEDGIVEQPAEDFYCLDIKNYTEIGFDEDNYMI